jgi:hypothetical protein
VTPMIGIGILGMRQLADAPAIFANLGP